jgi:hypothetical protein
MLMNVQGIPKLLDYFMVGELEAHLEQQLQQYANIV